MPRTTSFDEHSVLQRLCLLFWSKGYEATTQADMVQHAGISSSSLYNTFGNKPQIFEAVLECYNDQAASVQEPIIQGSRGLDDVIDFLSRARQRLQSDEFPPGCLVIRTMNELAGHADGEHVAELTTVYRERTQRAIQAALKRAADLGEISASAVPDRALLLFSVLMGSLSVATSNSNQSVAMIDQAINLVESWRSEG